MQFFLEVKSVEQEASLLGRPAHEDMMIVIFWLWV